MTRKDWLGIDPINTGAVGCALVIALGTCCACGGKIAPTDGQDEEDGATGDALLNGCGPLDPTLMTCGTDGCGNPVSPICRFALWVCPPIPCGCSTDASSPVEAASGPVGFACGSGTCPSNTFCQDPFGTIPGACIPFPLECKNTPYTPSATCACLERRVALDKVCRPNRFLCPYPTADFNELHIGCIAE
jgi:hypothetical protein